MRNVLFNYLENGIKKELKIMVTDVKIQTKIINDNNPEKINLYKIIEFVFDKEKISELEVATFMNQISNITTIDSIIADNIGIIVDSTYEGSFSNIYILERAEKERSIMLELSISFTKQGE